MHNFKVWFCIACSYIKSIIFFLEKKVKVLYAFSLNDPYLGKMEKRIFYTKQWYACKKDIPMFIFTLYILFWIYYIDKKKNIFWKIVSINFNKKINNLKIFHKMKIRTKQFIRKPHFLWKKRMMYIICVY